jgi:multicomponent Na+:H+ antiporter subunit E
MLRRGGVLPDSRYVGKVGLALKLGAFFLKELVYANLRLARDVIVGDHSIRPGIIALPLDAKSDSEIVLLAALINLTPGSVALDISPDRGTMYVHSMYVDTAEAARAEIKDGYERRVLQLLR